MVSNSFRAGAVARILVLAALMLGCMYSLFRTHWIVTPAILFIAIIAMVYELLVYTERTNREFTNFLLSIKSADFSKYNTADKRGKSFAEFKKALNIITEEFQMVRIDKEANYIFLQTIVEHINTAIISFDNMGEIKLFNEAAKTLLNLPFLSNINSLQQVDPGLCNYLTRPHTAHNPVYETIIRGEQLKLSIRSIDFKMQGVDHKLISIQNIRTEIEHTEAEAWEQLLKVLTHEIMNSITPLSSLSATLKSKADTLLQQQQFDAETMDDLSQGLNVIARRSMGLMNFVHHYKSLIALPTPDFKMVPLAELLEDALRLKHEAITTKGIELDVNIRTEPVMLRIDAGLVEQVLINLINNAIDALDSQQNGRIELSADVVNNKTTISISDNGPGIDKADIDKIFIPFFTTKNKGSGIGLSLSRQIMRMHGGSISVNSSLGNGTVFTLEFPSEL